MLVLTGRYIGYLPDHYVSATKFPVRLRQLLPERFGYDVTMELATRARTAQPPAMASFLAEMGREFGENAKSLGMNVK
jgi:DNA-binding transcriptional LysR family regulator